MRRLAPLVVVVALLACIGGSARADTFAVVPTTFSVVPTQAAVALPSFTTPNGSGSLVLPLSLSAPPISLQQLGYPQLLGIWQQAGAAYGIPWQVLAAINQIESNFGRNMGPSSAGAIGWMQFMPSTWLRWGTDASGDGVADPWNATDAIYSAARYLAAAGGGFDLYRAVFAYNHADWYVREVLDLANTFGADGTIALSLDHMQQDLDAARKAVAAAGDELVAAKRAENRTARVVRRLLARANRAPLLSDRLALQERAGVAGRPRAAAAALVADRARVLDTARQALVQAQESSAAASFAPGASQVLAAPTYAGGYVFPVGGGPGLVFASHTHHDYPAVDIAAAQGAPLYALADSIVLRAWAVPEARCGIGFTIQAFDGQVWTYCHLSYRDPSVVEGATLSAGQAVGLVGSTGHATGPHLHLQHQPATSWPQQEAWFEAFAGTAFTWSDTATPATADGSTLAFVPGSQPTNGRSLAFVSTSRPGAPVFEMVPETPDQGIVMFSRSGA